MCCCDYYQRSDIYRRVCNVEGSRRGIRFDDNLSWYPDYGCVRAFQRHDRVLSHWALESHSAGNNRVEASVKRLR